MKIDKNAIRILWYLKNYDITEKNLADEIAKQFNITINNLNEIEETKKFSKVLKIFIIT